MRRTVVAMGAVAALVLGTASTALAWPEYVEGRPEQFEPGGDSAYYIWHTDESGWHLSTTGPGPHRHFRAVIRTDGEFEHIDQIKLDEADSYRLEDGGKRLIVDFHTHGHTDNIKWRVKDGEWLAFRLFVDGHPIRANNVYIGEEGTHPPDATFRVRR
jgi:hypothetical protein